MAVTALSLPEMIILRKVLRPPLLAVFVALLTAGIIGSATCSMHCFVSPRDPRDSL
jgi:uncharacterized membrane protein YraQ (UPF0718 family)